MKPSLIMHCEMHAAHPVLSSSCILDSRSWEWASSMLYALPRPSMSASNLAAAACACVAVVRHLPASCSACCARPAATDCVTTLPLCTQWLRMQTSDADTGCRHKSQTQDAGEDAAHGVLTQDTAILWQDRAFECMLGCLGIMRIPLTFQCRNLLEVLRGHSLSLISASFGCRQLLLCRRR